MKIKLGSEEWFPVYVENESGYECEVPDELLERHRKLIKEFNEVQEQLGEIVEREREKDV